MHTKNLNKGGMKNWNRIKRNVDGIPDNNVEESTISKDDLAGFLCRLLDHSAIN